MAKKDKVTAKKADALAKKGEAATSDASKAKKGGKERFKGKGKWAGSCGDGAEDLAIELAALGLRIKDITGDGNCFFRALGDQLQGDERQHVQLRQRVVSYILDNQEDFAPFVEDDEGFDSYIARMKKDGVWAGYMEVVAASRCLEANLTIYQAGQPRWRVINHPEDSTPMLHLSYHDGQHYNSVRCADDFGSGPPAPVVIRGDGTIVARQPRPAGDGRWDEQDERRVASNTACTDMALVRKALEEARGDVEVAIERVIEALAVADTEAEPIAEAEPPETGGGASISGVATAPPLTPPVAAEAAPLTQSAEAARTAGTDPASPQPVAGPGEASSEPRPGTAAVSSRSSSGERDDGPAPCGGGSGGEATSGSAASREPPGATRVEPGGADAAASSCAVGAASAASQASAPASAAKSARAGGTRGIAVGKAAARRTAAGAGAGAAPPANNKRCPCGSNKKYKVCCGPAAAAAERRRAAAGGGPDGAGSGTPDMQSAATTVVVAQVAALVI